MAWTEKKILQVDPLAPREKRFSREDQVNNNF